MAVTAVMAVKADFATFREVSLIDVRFVMLKIEVLLRRGLVRLMHISNRLTDLSQNSNKHQY
ncbi:MULTISPECIES: hypothetical protein [Idiomarina]|jgi:hypothetical protein|uniref:Uncharacterized protein n=1 Tax=Idiomarina abyssalis TaxID=86102 RepID=A0A8I1G831_9GAMM|nr:MULTISPECIES: hypothetical protein [Idiomarina]MBJ7266455.1 hypothetical protein [Idiomarina abyssalis]MBJ7274333.1 hypothetical protein [Idiomarina abyssalis]MBJ7315906.1 hypothetical protein [Idiomarina abyssalis]NWO01373.1 hypothetical protein [Idiomarinaceae bacterium]|tara:strand:- start:8338 stop:8523 length:186 start_codon:yes stop_codon:yes gene_type:complete